MALFKKKTTMDHILSAQQGELDAEYMYNEMAKVVEKDYPEVAENFRKVAKSERAHYNVCAKITGKTLTKPVPVKAILVSNILKKNPKLALTLVANGEYDAASDYAPYILEYPQIESVLKDEIRHGDNAKELIAKYF
ncbi:MAG: rubrerythrin [Clostridia bacterium]|nr:rubrerythrin [Clostridia bacterium]MBQ8924914.1 rubrerythrin [Clostridia bacterium]